jgi:hypothetical protein
MRVPDEGSGTRKTNFKSAMTKHLMPPLRSSPCSQGRLGGGAF